MTDREAVVWVAVIEAIALALGMSEYVNSGDFWGSLYFFHYIVWGIIFIFYLFMRLVSWVLDETEEKITCDAPLRVYVWRGKRYIGEGELVEHTPFMEAKLDFYGEQTDQERFERYLVNIKKIRTEHLSTLEEKGYDFSNLLDFDEWKKHDDTLSLKSSPKIELDNGDTFYGFMCYWTAIQGYGDNDARVQKYMGVEVPPKFTEVEGWGESS